MSSPNMTSQIPIISFPLQAWPFLVRFREALGNRRIFMSWAPQFTQNLFLRVDSASCWYNWLFYTGFSTKEKLSKFHCIWPLKGVTEEQVKARTFPKLAEPIFICDLAALCQIIDSKLCSASTDPIHLYIYARDMAYFKLRFFSGDRPSDLSHIKAAEILHFPNATRSSGRPSVQAIPRSLLCAQ